MFTGQGADELFAGYWWYKDVVSDDFTMDGMNIPALSIGFIAAFFTGLVACTWMIQLVKKSKLTYFAFYCLLVGFVAIIWSFAG